MALTSCPECSHTASDQAIACPTKRLQMTLRYAHLAPTHKAAAVDKLTNALTPRATSRSVHVRSA